MLSRTTDSDSASLYDCLILEPTIAIVCYSRDEPFPIWLVVRVSPVDTVADLTNLLLSYVKDRRVDLADITPDMMRISFAGPDYKFLEHRHDQDMIKQILDVSVEFHYVTVTCV